METKLIINGKEKRMNHHSRATLLEALRGNGYTEAKKGCGMGECGACIVILNSRIVNSCQVLAASCRGAEILTSKAIGSVHEPHPIQRAFVDTGAVQCGFCTPAMTLVAFYLLNNNPNPDDEEIKRAFDGSLCRCTGYIKIIDAVKLASKRMINK